VSAGDPALSAQLAEAFKAACLAELEALKPGNVHIFADGHGMRVEDFARSAEAAAAPIAQADASVGLRIHSSIAATWDTVGCNTNLGIVLLCAPLAHAVLTRQEPALRERLRSVLQTLTIDDAALAFQAIVRASPAGLGQSARHDVHAAPAATLREAMHEAAQRDRIARQYTTDFADIFELGVPRYAQTLRRWGRPAWATTAVYLGFLSAYADTHIVRKSGVATAVAVQEEARAHEQAFLALDNPKTYQRELLKFDATLKARGINPGTSADLTVASVFAVALARLMESPPGTPSDTSGQGAGEDPPVDRKSWFKRALSGLGWC
jgi:triphosphoribosyl-dephospho-CoA synthase